jgi:hypothetical protein
MSPTSLCFKGCERRGANIEISRRDVCFWHLADILATLSDVRFRGYSGHRSGYPECLLLTQSGHCRNVHCASGF